MSESALIFDTHEDIQELVKSGMPEPQAETVVRQRVRLLERNLATKADIAATNADIETLRLETKADIAATNANIETLRLETKAAATNADIETLRLETKADIAATNANIETLRLETKADIAQPTPISRRCGWRPGPISRQPTPISRRCGRRPKS